MKCVGPMTPQEIEQGVERWKAKAKDATGGGNGITVTATWLLALIAERERMKADIAWNKALREVTEIEITDELSETIDAYLKSGE